MFIVLAHYGDQLAQSVYQRLCERHGTKNTRLLNGDELALSTCWAMRQEGLRSRTEMRFADGALLASDEITAVFNRLRFAAVPHFGGAGVADREYAVMEMHAFLLSWLSSLECMVVNRASPRSLGGELRGTAEWLLLAGRVGLLSRGMRFVTNARRFPKPQYEPLVPLDGAGLVGDAALKPTAQAILGSAPVHFMEPVGAERRRVVVIGEDVHGDEMPASLRDGCLRLARVADCTLVEFTFARTGTESDWTFCGANLFPPDLTNGELEELVRLLGSATAPPAPNKG